MQKAERRAATTAYKERKVMAGIYVLRCAAVDRCWVGRAPDLATIENRLRFALLHDSSIHASLRAAVREHGVGSISFEVLESTPADELPYDRERFLRDRLHHWQTQLGTKAIKM